MRHLFHSFHPTNLFCSMFIWDCEGLLKCYSYSPSLYFYGIDDEFYIDTYSMYVNLRQYWHRNNILKYFLLVKVLPNRWNYLSALSFSFRPILIAWSWIAWYFEIVGRSNLDLLSFSYSSFNVREIAFKIKWTTTPQMDF